MTASLPSAFRDVIARIVEHAPKDGGDWRIEEKKGTCALTIPKLADDGFEITVIADDQEVTVFSEYLAHQHFTSDGNHEETCQQAMGFVRDLLSPSMRLRVIEIGGSRHALILKFLTAGSGTARALRVCSCPHSSGGRLRDST